MRLVIEFSSIAAEDAPEVVARAVTHLLEGVININRLSLRRGEIPPLYESGVVYQDEPEDYESIVDGATTYRVGVGDCAHLAAWRVAELREAGEHAGITIEWGPSVREPGLRLYHVQVRRKDGSIEDPSVILGMNGDW